MFKRFISRSSVLFILAVSTAFTGATGCGGDTAGPAPTPAGTIPPALIANVVQNYAAIVHASYKDSLDLTKTLQTKVNEFVANPTQERFDAAKQAWLDVREIYGETEVYRFSEGPIDNQEDGQPEVLMNAWPLDEGYIDYVNENPNAGIINDITQGPITKDFIAGKNTVGGPTNISTGFHAIEFLLWGQDRNLNPQDTGTRRFTDYVTNGSGTAANQKRRADYLQAATDLLVDNFTDLVNAWAPGNSTNYRADFVSKPTTSLNKIVNGFGKMSVAELLGQRISAVFYNESQDEEEHSCFSDNTDRDIVSDLIGIKNVYFGTYRSINQANSVNGPGLSALIQVKNPSLDQKFQSELQTSINKADAVSIEARNGNHFDQQIKDPTNLTSPNTQRILAMIQALTAQGNTTSQLAQELGITANFN